MSADMENPVKHFERELITVRTGRAHPALVEHIKVSCYGGESVLEIRKLASISTPEPQTIIIDPWDKGLLTDIEKAIASSELGVSPTNDGNVIYLKLPNMSAQRRDELVKVLHKKTEECHVAIRNIRKDYHNLIRDALKNKQISEDHSRRLNDALQKITDKYINICNEKSAHKEKEIKVI